MASPDESESIPLLNLERPGSRYYFPADTNSLKRVVSSLARTFRSYAHALNRVDPCAPICALVCAILAFFVVTNVGRKEPVYLRTSGPTFTLSEPKQRARSNRTLSARLLTLNTFIRPMFVGIGDYKDERLARLIPELAHFDTACLQELFWATGSRKRKFMDAAREQGLIYQASSPSLGLAGLLRCPPKVIDAGLAILSRYPIVKADYYTFSEAVCRSIDMVVAKGVLYARIRLFADEPTRYAHVFTTHMQANNHLEDVSFEKVRESQVRELANFLRHMIADDPDGVVIISGDFNMNARAASDDSSSSKEYKEAYALLQSFRSNIELQDILFKASNDSHPATSAGGLTGLPKKKECLDYIFLSSLDQEDAGTSVTAYAVTGSVQVDELRIEPPTSDAPYQTLSDHYAVTAKIVFKEMGSEDTGG